MFDSLLEEDPWVQEYGLRQKAVEKIETTRYNLVMLTEIRFPDLAALVKDGVEQIPNLKALQEMLIAISTAQDESTARHEFLTLRDSAQNG